MCLCMEFMKWERVCEREIEGGERKRLCVCVCVFLC